MVAVKKFGCNNWDMTFYQSFENNKESNNSYSKINFNKKELEIILKLYGQMVSRGEWRDYSVSYSYSNASFSVFRRSSERPLYMIRKTPSLSKKIGMYSVVGMDGRIIKQGKDLTQVLQILNKKLYRIIKKE